jgi:hypothetical protein
LAIKYSLEYHGICEVSRIYSGIFKDGTEMKKAVFLRIKLLGTQAASNFEARLMHNWEEKVYKLDRWEQPIVTKVDEYGNPIQYQKWIVKPAKYQEITEWKHNIEGEFTVWSDPEHENEPDAEEVAPYEVPYEVPYEALEEEPVLEMPVLKRQTNAENVGFATYPLILESTSGQETTVDEEEIRKLFNIA